MADKKQKVDPLLAEVMADALAIQDRFIPEPMLKTTGRGVMKSRGVEGLIEDAEELRRKFAQKKHADQTGS